MKRLMSKVKRPKGSEEQAADSSNNSSSSIPQGDSPEAIVAREAKSFCESGAPGSNTAGEEYLHLPAIVDGAESSPKAAKEAALTIRKYLSKEHYARGFAQYNAVMLMRILTDNPARRFTQNIDKDFVATVKKLLRESRDQSVQQLMRETLDYFEAEKAVSNDTLGPLMDMWRKEKGLAARLTPQPRRTPTGVMSPERPSRTLPPPEELAARVEEARTTARLLVQTMQSTPESELRGNELVSEFGARARAAQKSIHGYMHCDPPPDDETMMTLIETNEQLNLAMSKHQRALLSAKRTNSNLSTPVASPPLDSQQPMLGGQNVYQNPAPITNGRRNLPAEPDTRFAAPVGPPPSQRQPERPVSEARSEKENPFSDDASYDERPPAKSYSLFGRANNNNATTTTNGQTHRPYSPSFDHPSFTSSDANPSSNSRPGGYSYGQTTQSYLNRQDSAAKNLTMHGASPPLGPTK